MPLLFLTLICIPYLSSHPLYMSLITFGKCSSVLLSTPDPLTVLLIPSLYMLMTFQSHLFYLFDRLLNNFISEIILLSIYFLFGESIV